MASFSVLKGPSCSGLPSHTWERRAAQKHQSTKGTQEVGTLYAAVTVQGFVSLQLHPLDKHQGVGAFLFAASRQEGRNRFICMGSVSSWHQAYAGLVMLRVIFTLSRSFT